MSRDTTDTRTQGPFAALFWQCLAKAYLPPGNAQFLHALREDWPGLLGEIAGQIGLSLQPDIDAIAGAVHETGDSRTLLTAYSRLFLVPPVAAPLNLGCYLDVSAFGASALSLDALYRRYGLAARSDILKDNPDHLARVIEFVGFLSADDVQAHDTGQLPEREPRVDLESLRSRILLRALPEMIRRAADAETAHRLPCLYSRILSLTLSAVRDHDGLLFEESGARPEAEQSIVPESAVAADLVSCSECGSAIIAAPEMQVIADRLRLAGLPVDHLSLCPDCRDGGRGWERGLPDAGLSGFQYPFR